MGVGCSAAYPGEMKSMDGASLKPMPPSSEPPPPLARDTHIAALMLDTTTDESHMSAKGAVTGQALKMPKLKSSHSPQKSKSKTPSVKQQAPRLPTANEKKAAKEATRLPSANIVASEAMTGGSNTNAEKTSSNNNNNNGGAGSPVSGGNEDTVAHMPRLVKTHDTDGGVRGNGNMATSSGSSPRAGDGSATAATTTPTRRTKSGGASTATTLPPPPLLSTNAAPASRARGLVTGKKSHGAGNEASKTLPPAPAEEPRHVSLAARNTKTRASNRVAFVGKAVEEEDARLARDAAEMEVVEEYGSHLSKRAIHVIQRVNDILRRCSGRHSFASSPVASRPTEEEYVMYSVITNLRESTIGPLFLNHPEVTLSNRACVITTPEFHKDEDIDGYQLRGVFTPGTIGRSYFARRERPSAILKRASSSTEDGDGRPVNGIGATNATTTTTTASAAAAAATTTTMGRMSKNYSDLHTASSSSLSSSMSACILKEVNFVLRRHLLEPVIREQRVLVNINYDNILKICDILTDDLRENMIIITNLQPLGNVTRYAGKLDEEPDKLRRILREVGVGLRIIHSHKIYHHNLKLENVLEMGEGRYCITDAGFSQLFTSQCPEALVFNGELACLPPEVFDEDGVYANDRNELDCLEEEGAAGATAMTTIAMERLNSNASGTATHSTGVVNNSSLVSASALNSISGASNTRGGIGGPGCAGAGNGGALNVAAVDIWGFGVFMYRLAYGKDPFPIAGRTYDEVRTQILTFKLDFPPKPHWPFAADLENVISWCLEKKPGLRPTSVKLLLHPFFKDVMSQSFHNLARLVQSAPGSNAAASTYSLSRRTPSVSMLPTNGALGGGAGGGTVSGSVSGGGGSIVGGGGGGGGGHVRSLNGYTADAVLGRGRFSETLLVHLRRDPSVQYAFKLLNRSVLRRLEEKALAEQAGTIMRQLALYRKMQHPNIVQCIDIVDGRRGDCFLIEEYVPDGRLHAIPPVHLAATHSDRDGGSSRDDNDDGSNSSSGRRNKDGSASEGRDDAAHDEPDLRHFLEDVLCGLVRLQDNGIAHLVLTPSNVLYCAATGHFKINDYGPLFLTVDELLAARAAGQAFYKLPKWLWKERPMNGFHVDSFFIGLLAASTVPALFTKIWADVLLDETTRPVAWQQQPPSSSSSSSSPSSYAVFATQELIQAVRDADLPDSLVQLIEMTMTRGQTARELLQHPYFADDGHSPPVPPAPETIPVSAAEVRRAVQARPEVGDESRMRDVLGQDPLLESQLLSSAAGDAMLATTKSNCTSLGATTATPSAASMTNIYERNGGGSGGGSVGAASPASNAAAAALSNTMASSNNSEESSVMQLQERPSIYTFQGPDIKCGQCGAVILVTLFRCVYCTDCIRCGKCAVDGVHREGHPLIPFVVHTIEHDRDGTSRATLFHPSQIQDVHALEELEMQENFPVGALSAHLTGARYGQRGTIVLDGSGQSSVMGGNGSIARSAHEMESEGNLHDTVSSSSTIITSGNVRSFTSGRHQSSASGFGPTTPMGESTSMVSFPVGLGQRPLPPSLTGGKHSLAKVPAKRLALPKAEDMDDETWQQELERCREKNLSELLLYNFSLDEVPRDVYNPPPLQVVFLDLSQNNLTSLPHELSFLIHLRKLVVSYNKLTDLPDSLGNLSELEVFDASHNMLSDLPQTFIYLNNLESIAMDYNNCATIPDSILEILPAPSSPHSCAIASDALSMQTAASVSGPANSQRLSMSVQSTSMQSPRLSTVYLAANDRLTTFPPIDRLRRFNSLKIAIDNEPSLYRYCMELDLERKLPNVTISWNKIYPDEIIPHLYCGSLRSAQSQMVYKKLKISYVLTVGRELVPVPPEGGKHKVIVVDDIPGADIVCSMKEAVEFIDESQLRGEGCLVHCFAGLSRSATTVIAYLMIRKHMRLDEAYMVTKKGRPAIFPNKGFMTQLLYLDKQLFPNDPRPLNMAQLGRPPE